MLFKLIKIKFGFKKKTFLAKINHFKHHIGNGKKNFPLLIRSSQTLDIDLNFKNRTSL